MLAAANQESLAQLGENRRSGVCEDKECAGCGVGFTAYRPLAAAQGEQECLRH